MDKYLLQIKVLLWSAFIILWAWLFYMAVVPSGKITYKNDMDGGGGFLGKITPKERVEAAQGGIRKIIGDPVYFNLITSRRFGSAELTIKYRRGGDNNEKKYPIIEAGILSDGDLWRYNLVPLENVIIDSLLANNDWHVLRNDDLLLLEKEDVYSNIDEFLNNPPAHDKIAIYNYDFKNDFIIKNYKPSLKDSPINIPLRGDFQFFTYIKDEKLDFDFSFVDLNKNKDQKGDGVKINLYYDNILINSINLDDDGIIEDSGDMSKSRDINLSAVNLPEGVYRVEVRANDDIITKKIITRQSKISFINKIHIFEDGNMSNIFTDSGEVSFETIYPGSLQSLDVGGNKIELGETYQQKRIAINAPATVEIKTEKNGIILAGDGVFSFNADMFFNPGFKKISPSTDFKTRGIEYILANYNEGKNVEDGWRIAKAKFDLTRAFRYKGKYGFLISIPGLNPANNDNNWVEIDEISVYLEGGSLWSKVKAFFN